MAATIDFDFGSVGLDTTIGVTIGSIEIRNSKPVATHNLPHQDGAIAETAKLGPKTITVSGDIVGSSYDTLRGYLDSLSAALADGLQKFTLDDERYIMAQMRDFSYSYDHVTRRATWTASFTAHFPFWLSETLKSDVRAPTSGVGYTVANAGNAPTRVKAKVTAPAGGPIINMCQLENTTRSELCKFTGTIAAAKILEIDNRVDTDDFEVLNDSVDAHTSFEGDFLNLSSGNNTIEYTGTAGATIGVYWRDAWY